MVLGALLVVGAPPANLRASAAATGTVTFSAGGDFGANSNTGAVLRLADTFGARYLLSLGDFDYDQTSSDAAWCDFVHTNMPSSGPTFPFELVVGNHEDDNLRDGYIFNFTACLPDRLGAKVGPGSAYGVEYYVDYPATNPMVRSIMLASGLSVAGTTYTYGTDSPHRAWLLQAISSARAAGIPWITVGNHYPCLSTNTLTCGMTQRLMKLLVRQNVDLILQGHNHIYERSKQLATNSTTCTDISVGTYNSACVKDTGADGLYTKGAGSIVLTLGSSGMTLAKVKLDDPETRYFAATNDNTYGFTKFTATPTTMRVQFLPAIGSFADTFSIVAP